MSVKLMEEDISPRGSNINRWSDIEELLREILGLRRPPVAVSFPERPPEGVSRFSGGVPSSCTFWRLAAEGRTFYTTPDDHYNCPVGAYTLNIPLPAERVAELDQTLGLMTGIGYLRMEEVPGIPLLPTSPKVIVFAPLGGTPQDPDVVLLSCLPDKLMLFQEAAIRARVSTAAPLLGRPTCMAIPATLAGGIALSTGCIGNRVYTDLANGELYAFVAGRDLPRLAASLTAIRVANVKLAAYHQERRRQLADP